jgi:uronate dehydrogenase
MSSGGDPTRAGGRSPHRLTSWSARGRSAVAPRTAPPTHTLLRVQTLVITGAAGRIGGYLRSRMRRPDRLLRLLDVAPVTDLVGGEEAVLGSLTDRDLVRRAVVGADAVVHLGGIPTEAPWADILTNNVDGTQSVFEAAAAEHVGRVVVASSNHAAGFWEHPGAGERLPDTVEPRPDTYYGWSKAAIESLGRLYHERFGMTVVNLRIGACIDRPPSILGAQMWLSPDDVGRLVEASVDPRVTGFHTVWGMSDNTGSWWSLEGGRAIGFTPEDDGAPFAAAVAEHTGHADGAPERVGGTFTTAPLGERI